MKILFVVKDVPKTADVDGMSRWIFNAVRQLVHQRHIVHVVGITKSADEQTTLSELTADTYVYSEARSQLKNWRALLGWDASKIRSFDRRTRRRVSEMASGNNYDLVIFCGHGSHAYLRDVRAGCRMLAPLDAYTELHQTLASGTLSQVKTAINQRLIRSSLRSYNEADCVVVVSDADRDALKMAGVAAPIMVCPLGVDTNEFRPSERKRGHSNRTILFTGVLDFPPNLDASTWLVQGIFQGYQLHSKGIKCVIAGRRPPSHLENICRDAGVRLLADLPDLREVFDEASLYVAPMRLGLGMKTKSLEAMAMGLPVLGTAMAFNGLTNPEGVMLCETAEEFATNIIMLCSDAQAARAMGEAGRGYVVRTHSAELMAENLLKHVPDRTVT